MDLLEVTLTFADPEMAPLTTMTAALLDPAAAVNCANVETVVVVPPRPPVVLGDSVSQTAPENEYHDQGLCVPSILSGIADVSGVRDGSPLLDAARVYDGVILDSGSGRGCDARRQQRQGGQDQSLLHFCC